MPVSRIFNMIWSWVLVRAILISRILDAEV